MTKATQIFFSISSIAIGLFFGFFGLLYFLLSSKGHWLPFAAVLFLAVLVGLNLYIFNFFKTKKRTKIAALIVGISLLATIIHPAIVTYQNNIPTVSAEVNIYEYMPNTNSSLLAQLDESPMIQLTENLPEIDGATALYPLYAAAAQAIYPKEADFDPYDGIVMVNTTPEAYTNLINGTVDLIFAAMPSKQQINFAEKRNVEFELTPVGREAFVFFVNEKNAIENLTIEQIKGIYSGEITNWSVVGGEDEKIRAFQRPQDSGSQTALQNLMGDTPIMEPLKEDVATGMGGIIEEVATYKNYKNAIGYTFRYYSNEMVKNDQIKLLSLNEVHPTKENIRNGTYPIASEFYIVTRKGDVSLETKKLIDWFTSKQGQQLVEKAGYVPVTE